MDLAKFHLSKSRIIKWILESFTLITVKNEFTNISNLIKTGMFGISKPGEERTIRWLPLSGSGFIWIIRQEIFPRFPLDWCNFTFWLPTTPKTVFFDQSIILKVGIIGFKLHDDFVAILDVIRFFNKQILKVLETVLLFFWDCQRKLRMIHKLWKYKLHYEQQNLKIYWCLLTVVAQNRGTLVMVSALLV